MNLVLRQADVPAGYRLDREESGLRTNQIEAREYPELHTKFIGWGRLTGYQAEYDRRAATIDSRADVFRGRAGARGMFRWFVQEVRGQTQLHLRPASVPIGDEGLVYRWKALDADFTVVVWRYGRVFAVVGGEGITKNRMLALARTQQHRIAAALA